jgi:hypothetical protein
VKRLRGASREHGLEAAMIKVLKYSSSLLAMILLCARTRIHARFWTSLPIEDFDLLYIQMRLKYMANESVFQTQIYLTSTGLEL